MQDIDNTKPAAAESDFKKISVAELSEGRSMLDFVDSGRPVHASVSHGPDYRLRVILRHPLDNNSTVRREWYSPPNWWRPLGMRKSFWRAIALKTLDDPIEAHSEGWIRANGQQTGD